MHYKLYEHGVFRHDDEAGLVTSIVEGGTGWDRYLLDVEDGVEVLPADPPPEPEPTPAEQIDQIVADGKAAINQAKTLADVKGAFASTLDSLGTVLGTGQGV